MNNLDAISKRYPRGAAPTAHQMQYIQNLKNERKIPESILEYHRNLWRIGSFDARTASLFIDTLLTFPVIEGRVRKNDEELVGMHVIGQQAVRVKRAKSGNLYASVLTQQLDGKWSFVYTAGLISKVSMNTRMNREQAESFGKFYSICCVCSRELTDPDSVARGIGPECAKKFA